MPWVQQVVKFVYMLYGRILPFIFAQDHTQLMTLYKRLSDTYLLNGIFV